MTVDEEVTQLLNAAEKLFYARGYQSVGMAELREASGLPLKRIYALFSGKTAIAVAMLERRDEHWCSSLTQRVNLETDPQNRVLAIFDWLGTWLANEGHRGCAWINAFGELGATSPEITAQVHHHKNRVRNYVNELVADAQAPQSAADTIFLLMEGCMVTAGISGNTASATQARTAAAQMLNI